MVRNNFKNTLLCTIGCLVLGLSMVCAAQSNGEFLRKVLAEGEQDEVGARCGYVNPSTGDTVIAIGKYYYCYTDTIRTYGIVVKYDNTCVAIDKKGKELFQVYWFDNGPDYASDGLFRIIQNGKIGYADTTGKITIPPMYDCAEPFANGMAKVATQCSVVPDGEHRIWSSEQWYWIDKSGAKVR
jgi:hypothetical protein